MQSVYEEIIKNGTETFQGMKIFETMDSNIRIAQLLFLCPRCPSDVIAANNSTSID